jgi:hypothetical protein
MLITLHKHLTQLQREGIISSWTDREILAGEKVDKNISNALSASKLFIALLSPDYIASNYCYEKEFKKALEMQRKAEIIIVPIIVEPCDWLSTPFKEFKALPKDGKAVSTWENKNTAFLDVIQNIRKLVEAVPEKPMKNNDTSSRSSSPRNYRVQKDFDTIEKIEFTEKTFNEVKEYLRRYIDEILEMDNIRARILTDDNKIFEGILVNRNKIATESQLKLICTNNRNSDHLSFRSGEMQLSYTINNNRNPSNRIFQLNFDEYHLFWSENAMFIQQHNQKEFLSKDIADIIWNEWLESVGIM